MSPLIETTSDGMVCKYQQLVVIEMERKYEYEMELSISWDFPRGTLNLYESTSDHIIYAYAEPYYPYVREQNIPNGGYSLNGLGFSYPGENDDCYVMWENTLSNPNGCIVTAMKYGGTTYLYLEGSNDTESWTQLGVYSGFINTYWIAIDFSFSAFYSYYRFRYSTAYPTNVYIHTIHLH